MKVLIVEDDATLRTLVATYLGNRGYEVCAASGGMEALQLAAAAPPDLVILDVMMPGMDGWETMAELRKTSYVPVLFLTARGGEEDVIRGLELGADDYLKKPFSMKELALRVGAVLRRVAESGSAPAPAYDDGWLRVDLESRAVHVNGSLLRLTPTEYRLLTYLVIRRGRAVTHKELLREAWGPEYADDVSTLQVYIRYLREKLERDPRKPAYIVTEWGVGYRFAGQTAFEVAECDERL